VTTGLKIREGPETTLAGRDDGRFYARPGIRLCRRDHGAFQIEALTILAEAGDAGPTNRRRWYARIDG
jgi:hypothetical protein